MLWFFKMNISHCFKKQHNKYDNYNKHRTQTFKNITKFRKIKKKTSGGFKHIA